MSKKNILVIDDSNTNLVLLESLLRRDGYTVFSAQNGKEGLDSVDAYKPDLIFLDLKMPEIDGFEFIRKIRNKNEWKDIPIIIVSAISDRETILESIELGVVEYLTKPIDIERVLHLTNNILNN